MSVVWNGEKTIIAYYSYSGNTRFVAEQIQEVTHGDCWEIQPQKPYPLQYNACVEQARKEIQTNFHPELLSRLENLSDYEVIFVGSPNWWSTIAPPVATFLSQGDFSGKIIIPFITHGGGGMARCMESVQKLCPHAKIISGGTFSGGNIRRESETIRQWLTQKIKK